MMHRPLNRAQGRFWKIEQIAGGKSKPNEVLCFELSDSCDLERLVAVLRSIVAENFHYYSRLIVTSNVPFWSVGTAAEVAICNERKESLEDDTHPFAKAEGDIGELFRAERLYDFDLEKEFPIRIRFVDCSERRSTYLLIAFHPIVMTRAHLNSVAARINKEMRAQHVEDYQVGAKWQWSAGSPTDEERPSADNSGASSALALQSFPTDRMRDEVKRFATSLRHFSIGRNKIAALSEICGLQPEEQHLGLLTLFAIVAARYSQQTEIFVGLARSHLTCPTSLELDTLFDHVPIKFAFTDRVSFRQAIQSLRSQIAFAQRATPFLPEGLLEADGPVASAMSYSPFCQLAFQHLNAAKPTRRLDLARLFPEEPEYSFSHSEIELKSSVSESGDLNCSIEYSIALFDPNTVERFTRHLCSLLDVVISHPDQPIVEFDIMTEDERREVSAFNPRRVPYPDDTLGELFAAQCRRTPHAVALADGASHVTFELLERLSCRLATRLSESGVTANGRVGVCLPRSVEFVVSVLAILRCGAAYVPIDEHFPIERIRYIEQDSQLQCLLHNRDDSDLPRWMRVDLRHLNEAIHEQAAQFSPQQSDPAYVIYTSGSTGMPKGVVGTHRSVVNRIFWAKRALDLEQNEVFCMKTKITFIDHVAELFQPLLNGLPLVIARDEDVLNSSAFVQLLLKWSVTRLTLVPFALASLLECGDADQLRMLRSVLCSGDALTFGLARRFFVILPATRLFNVYGLTETGADSTFYEIPYDQRYGLAEFFASSQKISSQFSGPDVIPDASEITTASQITQPGVTLDVLRRHFEDASIPQDPISVDRYMRWLDKEVLPFLVNVSSEKFIGHMTSALPTFMAQLSALIARLNQNMVKVETSKSLTLLERQLLAALHKEFFQDEDYAERIQNPDHIFGLVVSGGSSANITALCNARNRALMKLGFQKSQISECGAFELLKERGYEGFAIIASGLAHYSIRKAASILGIGERNLLLIKRDANQKADLNDLRAKIQFSRDRRLLVIAVIGIAGATETGTIDPIARMAKVCAEHDLHFHVDAAWGGAMMFSEKYKALLQGIQQADTITLCPHKQLYVPQGISLCLFKDSTALHASSVQAVYQGRRGSFDFGQYTIEGSRPAIFLALHAMFHVVSKRGIGALVEQGVEKVQHLAQMISRSDAFELVGSPEINILNYRYIPRHLRHKRRFSSAENREISEAVVRIQERQFLQGRTFVSKTDIVNEAYCKEAITVFRVVIANPLTSSRDLRDNLAEQLEIAEHCVERRGRGNGSAQGLILDRLPRQYLETVDRHGVPIGQPIDNTEIFVLDRERRLLPVGIVGELFIGGDGLSNGYTSAVTTDQSFVPHPFDAGQRLFRTGDFGRRLADGNIEFCGRRDQQVKVRGVRIDLAEIEANLVRLNGVRQSAVLAFSNYGDTAVAAFVVLDRSQRARHGSDEKRLRRELITLLPLYMIPERVYVLDALPLTGSGKIDRERLRRMCDEPASTPMRSEETSTESKLREIWQHILNRPSIDSTDNFFEIGGHSLAAASMQTQIKKVFSVDVSLHSIFERPRLDDVAERIDESRARVPQLPEYARRI
jgi:putative pyridoxal-dependent aspartate 1-decarboxylase